MLKEFRRRITRQKGHPKKQKRPPPQYLPSLAHNCNSTDDIIDQQNLECENLVGLTPLATAVLDLCVVCVIQLLRAGADYNRKHERTGNNPIMCAAQTGCAATARILIQHGADCNLKNKSGETALHLATGSGKLDAARIISDNVSPSFMNLTDNKGRTPLSIAIRGGAKDENLKLIKHLLSRGADCDFPARCEEVSQGEILPPIILALYSKNMQAAMILAKAGAALGPVRYVLTASPDMLEGDPVELATLQNMAETPATLQNICRKAIRRAIAWDDRKLIKVRDLAPKLREEMQIQQ